MAWILAIIAMIASAFVLLVVALLAGQLIPPIYQAVMNCSECGQVGFQKGAETASRIGLKYTLPALALVFAFWFVLLKLRKDSYGGYRKR